MCQSVVVHQNGEIVRLDFSEEGWDGPPEETVGHWEAKVPDAIEPTTKKLDADSLMAYFEQLVEESNPLQQKFCYVLSLLLVQKRKLKIDGKRTDGEITYLEMSGARGEGPYEVRDQNLSGEEIKLIQSELNQHLGLE